jgi:hypothetical protein
MEEVVRDAKRSRGKVQQQQRQESRGSKAEAGDQRQQCSGSRVKAAE